MEKRKEKEERRKEEVKRKIYFYFIAALKKAPQLGHLYSPIDIAFFPLGASFHVFAGFATSVPHFGHFAIGIPRTFCFYHRVHGT